MAEPYHTPVLLTEAIDALYINPDGIYVDATFGGGGHSIEILKKLKGGKLFAFDQDPDAKANVPKDDRVVFIPENFRHIRNFLEFHGVMKVDGILADLGVSSHQFDTPDRGFSIRSNGPLDMRMDVSRGRPAKEMIEKMEDVEIMSVLRQYTDIQGIPKLARAIKAAQEDGELSTTDDLTRVANGLAPRHKENKYVAQVFQAIRIATNDEVGALKDFLEGSAQMLAPEGRLVVISYHSVEDRIAKHFFRAGDFSGEVKKDLYGNPLRPLTPVSNKAISPSQTEVERNNRARSAKMRVARKNG
jgi:16S rRNA (cytosine1402-N4)-methyltransferase